MIEKHIFALYIPSLDNFAVSKQITLHDEILVHRIQHVLRLMQGDHLILFDRRQHATALVTEITKKNVVVVIEEIRKNVVLHPKISMALPLLKKEAFEQALYSCIEIGASEIIPYRSEKMQGRKLDQRERERMEKIMISAAEQSKYYSFPELGKESALDELTSASGIKIFFDPDGEPARDVIDHARASANILLMVGPEGDLTSAEKEQLKAAGFLFCKLTPTVLRARQAVASALSLFRTML